jgi:protein-L-isoaspartate(D-aspartate) O-methyltransferase
MRIKLNLSVVRQAYARQILALAGIGGNDPLERAFAAVPRERFLGDPPWQLARFGSYQSLPGTDPVLAYQDVLFALSPQQSINNGSPSLHAAALNALAPRDGERVAHIGAGTGYYSAVLAELVGIRGRVTAVEFDPDLFRRAEICLRDLPNVEVVHGDGASWPDREVDCVYVNFASHRPADRWIEALADGGRLVFPLGAPSSRSQGQTSEGAALCITRRAGGFSVRSLGPAYFICAEGLLREPGPEVETLREAFRGGGIDRVRSLVWKRPATGSCWFAAQDWALSFEEIPA